VVLLAPVSAVAFVATSLPALDCEPRRTCLQQSVEQAWGTLLVRLGSLLVVCGALWWTRRRTPSLAHGNPVLVACLCSLLFSALAAHTLHIGMNAVIHVRTDVSLSLVLSAIAGSVAALAFWRALNRAGAVSLMRRR
jgi:hypothetical protein